MYGEKIFTTSVIQILVPMFRYHWTEKSEYSPFNIKLTIPSPDECVLKLTKSITTARFMKFVIKIF